MYFFQTVIRSCIQINTPNIRAMLNNQKILIEVLQIFPTITSGIFINLVW